MALEKCPRCGAKVQPTDSVCLECGLDLIEAKRKIAAEAKQEAAHRSPDVQQRQVAITNPAAAGIATDVGEDTRLRIFDEQLARQLAADRLASGITGGIAIIFGIGFAVAAAKLLQNVGGLRALSGLTPAYLRQIGFGAFSDQLFLGAVCLALSAAGWLIGIGQFHRVWTANQAIWDVKLGGRPAVVGISAFTTIGLIIASAACPLFGIILGIIFKFSQDDDTRDLGGKMILVGIAAIVLFGLNLLWGALSNLKPAAKAAAPEAATE